MITLDKEALFQLVLDDDPTWREEVLASWSCLNWDDKQRIRTLSTGRGAGGGGGGGSEADDFLRVFTPLDLTTGADHVLASNTTLGAAPVSGNIPRIYWNGRFYPVGNGNRDTYSFYFSNDFGATAKTYATLANGDKLYFNPLTAGETMASTDQLIAFIRI